MTPSLKSHHVETGSTASHREEWTTARRPHKAYSRDFMQRGRVCVQLDRDDGSLVYPPIPMRKALMLNVAELVPKHQSRIMKQQDSTSSSGATARAGGKGKYGKKKK